MNLISLNNGQTYQPEPGWKRISLAGSANVSVEYFEKPAGHTSPLHTHPQEQVCICTKGKLMSVDSDGQEVIMNPGDSVWFAPDEPHRVENAGDDLAEGIDIFAPARSFDFWLMKLNEKKK
ncbi:cupin domain-containing protein [bacterium]|nr:cupin domain-containing protein [FCB group bacterium]MBL7190193.1 cupin domain-containing protein [bacterium]